MSAHTAVPALNDMQPVALLQDAMYAPYDAEIDFLQDQISVLSDEIAERDKHIESLKSERACVGYEAGGFTGRGSRASSTAASDDGDRGVELQARTAISCVLTSSHLCCCTALLCGIWLHKTHVTFSFCAASFGFDLQSLPESKCCSCCSSAEHVG